MSNDEKMPKPFEVWKNLQNNYAVVVEDVGEHSITLHYADGSRTSMPTDYFMGLFDKLDVNYLLQDHDRMTWEVGS